MSHSPPNISDSLDEADAHKRIKQWGIFDWRDNAAYPSGRSDNNDMWRWEFLRRNITYRKIWDTWNSGWGQTATADQLIEFGLHDFLDPRLSYKKLIKRRPHIFQQYPAIVEGSEINWSYTDSSDSLDKDIQSILNSQVDSLIDIRIDLRRPIAPQMDSAAIRKVLCERQKKILGKVLRHRISDDASLYLRAMDAKFLGASNVTIGLHIFGCETKSSAATRGRQVEIKSQKMWQEF